jgi:hypothetical protein
LRVTIFRGHVKDGRIVVDEPTDLPEGTSVELALLSEADDLSPEEHADLEASLERGLAQAEKGEGSPAEDVLRRLRAI